MKKKVGIIGLAFFICFNANAQHQHRKMTDTSSPKMQMADTMKMENMDMIEMQSTKPMNHHMSMNHAYSLKLPMGRNGSGTAWLPDASPMYGYMFHTNK